MAYYNIAIYQGPSGAEENELETSKFTALAFPDRATADLFYRFIQTYPRRERGWNFTKLHRRSAQMWTYQGGHPADVARVVRFMWRPDFERGFPLYKGLSRSVMRHSYNGGLDDGDTVSIPPVVPFIHTLTDRLSGKWFYICNRIRPEEFWGVVDGYVTPDVGVYQATKFRLDLANPQPGTLGTPLLVDDDMITITATVDGIETGICCNSPGGPLTSLAQFPSVMDYRFRFSSLRGFVSRSNVFATRLSQPLVHYFWSGEGEPLPSYWELRSAGPLARDI
ncbi:hypothetical protein BDV19DRAFT_385365 [Aspergillus venezuelensis]